jgi:dTDP-4-amino-4,6-dideoxygalactose transaminase
MVIELPQWPIAGEREWELLREVLAGPVWGGSHPFVARFEEQFAAAHGCRYGITVANGTLALELALLALGIGAGDEVIVPAHSFIATAMAVSRVGAIPVFVDMEEDSFQMNPELARAALGPRVKAVMPVHFGGMCSDMDRIEALARESNLAIIEDAAQAQGAMWRGRPAGSFGAAACFSFQNSKVMTAGEGGILLTNDDGVAARARSLANQGRMPGHGWFDHFLAGSNFRLTGIQAALLLAQLERLPEQIALRRENARLLAELTAGVSGLTWQRVPAAADVHNYYLMLGRAGAWRNELCQALQACSVPCTPYYPRPLYANPVYQDTPCRLTPCPVAERLTGDAFWLSQRALMGTPQATGQIASVINEVMQARPAVEASSRR